MLEIDPFDGVSVKATEQIVAMVNDYLFRVAGAEEAVKRNRLVKADTLIAIDLLLRRRPPCPGTWTPSGTGLDVRCAVN